MVLGGVFGDGVGLLVVVWKGMDWWHGSIRGADFGGVKLDLGGRVLGCVGARFGRLLGSAVGKD